MVQGKGVGGYSSREERILGKNNNNNNNNNNNKREHIAIRWNTDHHLEQGSANYDTQAKFSLLPVFVNKVLLEHNHTQYHLCLFHTTKAELSNCGRDYLATKPQIVTVWPFTEAIRCLLI